MRISHFSAIPTALFAALITALITAPAFAQDQGEEMAASMWFGVLELPFLFAAVIFAFLTARALKGGIFGKGMAFMAWGFLVMGIGHLHMQIEHFTQFNLFAQLFGQRGGQMVWFVALVLTWTLSGLGFRNIYKASQGG